jgi:hypothetical protein
VATIGIMSDEIRALRAADEAVSSSPPLSPLSPPSLPRLQVRNGSFVTDDFILSTRDCVQRVSGWSTIPWL